MWRSSASRSKSARLDGADGNRSSERGGVPPLRDFQTFLDGEDSVSFQLRSTAEEPTISGLLESEGCVFQPVPVTRRFPRLAGRSAGEADKASKISANSC